VLRLILCGAVAGSLAALLITTTTGQKENDSGMTLVEAESSRPVEPEIAAQRVEAVEADRSLAQVWLIAFGAGAFFLLELVSPLGIFYRGPARTPPFPRVSAQRIRASQRLPVRQRAPA
jgi:hypothetical protein